MSRSKWKGPFLGSERVKTVLNEKKKLTSIPVVSRNCTITSNFRGLTFNVHNGKTYNTIIITEDMIGHKFGEFSFTRAKFSYKKKKSKNR